MTTAEMEDKYLQDDRTFDQRWSNVEQILRDEGLIINETATDNDQPNIED